MRIEVFGGGCRQCRALEKVAREAVAQLRLECVLDKSADPLRFIDLDITAIPALVVDGRLLTVGRVPGLAEMKSLLLAQ